MIRICAWCQQESNNLEVEELPGEKAYEQQSHGICPNHALRLRHTYLRGGLRQPHLPSPRHKRTSSWNIPMRLFSSLH
jgi:hypothetical protein